MNSGSSNFAVGDRVFHKKFGRGTVLKFWHHEQENIATIGFDGLGRKLLAIDYAPLEPLSACDDVIYGDISETFINDDSGEEHSMGSHWEPFYDDVQNELLKRLPSIIDQSEVLQGFGDTHISPLEPPSDWPAGTYLIWPAQDCGVTTAIEIGGNEILSIFPYFATGAQFRLRLESVIVWESSLEAHIEASWEGCPVTFFDSNFIVNRSWYQAGREYEFLLAGIAYSARVSTTNKIPAPSSLPEILGKATNSDEYNKVSSQLISIEGVAMLLPVDEGDRDEYKFRGPIKSVRQTKDFLSHVAWRVRVTVLRNDDNDFDLDIFVTQRVWGNESPPEVGRDMEGVLWLQGRLWYANC